MMEFLFLIIGILAGGAAVALYARRGDHTAAPEDEEDVEETARRTFIQDLVSLVAMNPAADLDCLIMEYGLEGREPDFFAKYMKICREVKEQYVNELIRILGRNRNGDVHELVEAYPNLSSQDLLLFIMNDLELPNKIEARILGLNMETLKKRKSRLKGKLERESVGK